MSQVIDSTLVWLVSSHAASALSTLRSLSLDARHDNLNFTETKQEIKHVHYLILAALFCCMTWGELCNSNLHCLKNLAISSWRVTQVLSKLPRCSGCSIYNMIYTLEMNTIFHKKACGFHTKYLPPKQFWIIPNHVAGMHWTIQEAYPAWSTMTESLHPLRPCQYSCIKHSIGKAAFTTIHWLSSPRQSFKFQICCTHLKSCWVFVGPSLWLLWNKAWWRAHFYVFGNKYNKLITNIDPSKQTNLLWLLYCCIC